MVQLIYKQIRKGVNNLGREQIIINKTELEKANIVLSNACDIQIDKLERFGVELSGDEDVYGLIRILHDNNFSDEALELERILSDHFHIDYTYENEIMNNSDTDNKYRDDYNGYDEEYYEYN